LKKFFILIWIFNREIGDTDEHFPYIYMTVIACFSLVLFIERVATNHHNHDDVDHTNTLKKSNVIDAKISL